MKIELQKEKIVIFIKHLCLWTKILIWSFYGNFSPRLPEGDDMGMKNKGNYLQFLGLKTPSH